MKDHPWGCDWAASKGMFQKPFISYAASLPHSTPEPMVINVELTVVGWCLIVHIEAQY